MPIDEIDIWRRAKLLIDRHCDDASVHAAMRADAMFDVGDLEGAAVWRRIVAAIDELQKTEPDGTMH